MALFSTFLAATTTVFGATFLATATAYALNPAVGASYSRFNIEDLE